MGVEGQGTEMLFFKKCRMFGYGDRPKNKQQLRIKSYQFFLQFSEIYDTIGIGNICFFNVSFRSAHSLKIMAIMVDSIYF